MTETTDPAYWTMDMGSDGTFPFVEDENCNITGLGHQDKDEFAEAINRYDGICGEHDENERYTADDIAHDWAVFGDDGESLHSVPISTPGAVPITSLWGAR